MKRNVLVTCLTCVSFVATLSGCGGAATNGASGNAISSDASADATESGDTAIIIPNQTADGYTMDLANCAGDWVYMEDYDCYGLENVVYCTDPTSSTLQSMNIYIPAAYMNEDGTVNTAGTINGYSAQTAPILYKNGIAGYMEAAPVAIADSEKEYMSAGFVYISVGSTGRATQAEDGTYIGKSPEGLVDLKAGVRFLKANNEVMAGNTDQIISIGTSAGGAMSALLGTTGNSKNYNDYLDAIGAVMNQTDDVYASQCYCPIIDLENADMAYEWEFEEDTSYDGFLVPGGDLSEFQQALSAKLADAYVDYYNGLELQDAEGNSLQLGSDGRSGSGYDYILGVLEDAATTYLTKLENGELDVDYTIDDYLSGNYTYTEVDQMSGEQTEKQGKDLSTFLTWDGTKATITDLDAYVASYNGRLKTCLAFDDLDMAQGENQELGDADTDTVHFSTTIDPLMEELKDEYPEEYSEYSSAYADLGNDEALTQRKYLINPSNYIGTKEECTTAQYFRIRTGTADPHTALTIGMNLALELQEKENTTVDYAMVWDQPHGEADYSGELTSWIKEITQK